MGRTAKTSRKTKETEITVELDLDGSGTTDLVYLGRGEVTCWINGCGNQLLPGPRLTGLPMFDGVSTVQILDFHGDGRACLVWSTPLPGRESPIGVIPLTPAIPSRLLVAVDNSLGRVTRLGYASSAAQKATKVVKVDRRCNCP